MVSTWYKMALTNEQYSVLMKIMIFLRRVVFYFILTYQILKIMLIKYVTEKWAIIFSFNLIDAIAQLSIIIYFL